MHKNETMRPRIPLDVRDCNPLENFSGEDYIGGLFAGHQS
jgi:hypothetical protein